MTTDILISIHGKYMERYKSGDKDVELRLTIPRMLQKYVNEYFGMEDLPKFPDKFRFIMYNTDTKQVESIAYINKKSTAAVLKVPGTALSKLLEAEDKQEQYVHMKRKEWINRKLFEFDFNTGCLDDEFAEYCEKAISHGGVYLLNFDSIKELNNPVPLEVLREKYNTIPNTGYIYASELLTKAIHKREIC